MKRVLTIAALCSLFAVPLYAADMYWEQSPPSDPTITDKDFSYKYGDFKRAKSLEKMDVYDSGERLKLDDEFGPETQATAPRRVRSGDVIDLPQRTPTAPTQAVVPTRRTRPEIQPAQREITPSRIEPAVHPQAPAPTVRPDIPEETRRPVPVPAIAEEPAKTEPKKLPWGQQTDLKPNNSQTTTPKLQWGKRPQ